MAGAIPALGSTPVKVTDDGDQVDAMSFVDRFSIISQLPFYFRLLHQKQFEHHDENK